MEELIEKLKDKHYDWFDIEIQLNIWGIYRGLCIGVDSKIIRDYNKKNIQKALIEVDFLKHM